MQPYQRDERVAYLSIVDDGVRANQARVIDVQPHERGWEVTTDLGRDVVDGSGEGTRVLPLDSFLKQEFAEKGDGFVVVREDRLRELPVQDLDWELDR